MNQSILIIVI